MLRQIYTDDYVYTATSSGSELYDITSELEYAYINYSGGFTTIWGNDDRVFYGTTNSGVKYINKTCISGSTSSPYDLGGCLSNLSDLTYYYVLTSNSIRNMHGYDDVLCVVTTSGVDVIKLDPQSYRSYTTINNAYKCFMTSEKFYYTTSGTEWSVERINSGLTDWILSDYSYVTGSGIFTEGVSINDIFITENTAADGASNTLFVATTSGLFKIDEQTLAYDIFYTEG